MDDIDVAIVGGGIAGLAAAQLIRRAGLRAVVLEAHQPGGRARTDERDGFRFNLGPHAIYLGGPAQRLLGQLGVALPGAPPDAARSLGRVGDRVGLLPQNARQLLATPLLGWRGKLAVGRLLARLPRMRPGDHATVTVGTWIDGLSLPDDAAALVHMLVRIATYANLPGELSADVAIGQVQAALGQGVRYLDGGWGRIVEQLAAGVDVRQVDVVGVVAERGGVVVTSAGGDELPARAAILAVAPDTAARLLDRTPFDVGGPIEAACLDLGLRRRIEPGTLFGVDQPLYLSQHAPPADLAPDGGAVVHVARSLGRDDEASAEERRGELRAHAALAGIADADIATSRYLHRMTVVTAAATADRGGLAGRPSTAASGVSGVQLAGDWVGPVGHLLDASCASASAAALAAQAHVSSIGRVA